MSAQLLQLAFHPQLMRQLLCLLLWCGASLSLLLLNRTLLHYSIFHMPWFLALGSAGLALVAGCVLLCLMNGFSDPLFQGGNLRVWRHVLLSGALMGTSAGLHNTAMQLLPLPAVVVLQVGCADVWWQGYRSRTASNGIWKSCCALPSRHLEEMM